MFLKPVGNPDLSNKVLSETEISVLGKGLQFMTMTSFINEAGLKKIKKILLEKWGVSGISKLNNWE